jgi:Anthrone oxygenase
MIWAIPMLLAGGLFTGGVVSIAWERIPAWCEAELPLFQTTFAHTLRRVDRLQPALLVVCLLSTIAFAVSEGGAARISAALAAAGFLIVLVGSAARLVPIQRRLVEPGSEVPAPELEKLRAQSLRGHEIRTIVALAYEYAVDFRRSLRKADPALPILVVICAGAAAEFAWQTSGAATILATAGIVPLAIILLRSIVLAEPINNQFRRRPEGVVPPDAERLRLIWRRFHLVRTALAVAAFALIVTAVSYA